MKRLLGLAALALFIWSLSCAHAPASRPRTEPAPAATALLEALRRRQSALHSIELETRTTSWLGGERARATVLMMVERAGRLRFEAEVPVQGAVASLAVRGQEFVFLDFQRHVFSQGPACPANVARLIPIPLLPDEIAAILLGDAPLGERAQAGEVQWDAQKQADVLVVDRPAAGAAAARLWITMRKSKAGYDVLGVEGQSPGARPESRWRVSYEDFTTAEGFPLPRLIRFAEPGKSFDDGVEIKVKERLGLNRPLRDELFTIAQPPGYPVEPLLCSPVPAGR